MRALRPMWALGLAASLASPFEASAQSPSFQPAGEILFVPWGSTGAGVSYSDDRIVGPNVNLTRRDDGGWAGDLMGQNVDLSVTPTRLSGPNFDVHIESKGDELRVRGNAFGVHVSVEVDPKRIAGRSGNCSFDLTRRMPGVFRGEVGCASPRAILPSTGTATLKLAGNAAAREPSLPQFALALLAAFFG